MQLENFPLFFWNLSNQPMQPKPSSQDKCLMSYYHNDCFYQYIAQVFTFQTIEKTQTNDRYIELQTDGHTYGKCNVLWICVMSLQASLVVGRIYKCHSILGFFYSLFLLIGSSMINDIFMDKISGGGHHTTNRHHFHTHFHRSFFWFCFHLVF